MDLQFEEIFQGYKMEQIDLITIQTIKHNYSTMKFSTVFCQGLSE